MNTRVVSVSNLGTSQPAVTTLAGNAATEGYLDGSALSALFRRPQGLALSAGGALYVADSGNNVVRKISLVKDASGMVTSASTVATVCGVQTVSSTDPPVWGNCQVAKFSGLTGVGVLTDATSKFSIFTTET